MVSWKMMERLKKDVGFMLLKKYCRCSLYAPFSDAYNELTENRRHVFETHLDIDDTFLLCQ